MELNIKDKAIGSGITFPLKVSNKDGKTGVYPVLGEVSLIENNIHALVLYPRGFRFRQEEYGSILESYLEEPNTQALMFLIKANIRSVISQYESRVNLTKIESQQYDSWLVNRIHFNIKDTPLQAYTDMMFNRNI